MVDPGGFLGFHGNPLFIVLRACVAGLVQSNVLGQRNPPFKILDLPPQPNTIHRCSEHWSVCTHRSQYLSKLCCIHLWLYYIPSSLLPYRHHPHPSNVRAAVNHRAKYSATQGLTAGWLTGSARAASIRIAALHIPVAHTENNPTSLVVHSNSCIIIPNPKTTPTPLPNTQSIISHHGSPPIIHAQLQFSLSSYAKCHRSPVNHQSISTN